MAMRSHLKLCAWLALLLVATHATVEEAYLDESLDVQEGALDSGGAKKCSHAAPGYRYVDRAGVSPHAHICS